MAAVSETTFLDDVCGILQENGFEGISRCVEILVNEAMCLERSQTLAAGPYERSEGRKGYANGFKSKTIKSRIGSLTFSVPQVRGDVKFYPSAWNEAYGARERSKRLLQKCSSKVFPIAR